MKSDGKKLTFAGGWQIYRIRSKVATTNSVHADRVDLAGGERYKAARYALHLKSNRLFSR